MQASLVLYNDIVNKRLLQGLNTSNPFTLPPLFQNDVLQILYYSVQPTGISGSPYEVVDLTAGTLAIAVGPVGQAPVALQTNFTPLPGLQAVINQTQVGSSTLASIQTIVFNQAPESGTWTVSFNGLTTVPLAYNITAANLGIALTNLSGMPALSVFQLDEVTYQVIFSNPGAQPALTCDSSRLITPPGFSGTLTLATAQVAALLGNASQVGVKLEIRASPTPSTPFVTFQGSANLYPDILAASSVITPTSSQVLALLNGSVQLPAGADNYTVTGLGLASAPAFISPSLTKADGTRSNIDTFLRAGWTSDSFTVDFDAVIPDATYVLTWLISVATLSVSSLAVPAGVDFLTVNLQLPRLPSMIVPVLVKQNGDANVRAFLRSGWGLAGFTVDFDAVIPDGTYQLFYLLIP